MSSMSDTNNNYGMTDREWIGKLIDEVNKNLASWDNGVQNREESLEKIDLFCREVVRVCEEW